MNPHLLEALTQGGIGALGWGIPSAARGAIKAEPGHRSRAALKAGLIGGLFGGVAHGAAGGLSSMASTSATEEHNAWHAAQEAADRTWQAEQEEASRAWQEKAQDRIRAEWHAAQKAADRAWQAKREETARAWQEKAQNRARAGWAPGSARGETHGAGEARAWQEKAQGRVRPEWAPGSARGETHGAGEAQEQWDDFWRDFRASRASRDGRPLHEVAPWLKGVSTKSEAKTKFRQQARANHPDMGGSADAMKRINEQWENVQKLPDFQKLSSAYALGEWAAIECFGVR